MYAMLYAWGRHYIPLWVLHQRHYTPFACYERHEALMWPASQLTRRK